VLGSATREHALDHVIVVLFENRSLGQPAGQVVRARRRQDVRGCDRNGSLQSDPGVGRAANLFTAIVADTVRDHVERALVHSRTPSRNRSTVRPPQDIIICGDSPSVPGSTGAVPAANPRVERGGLKRWVGT